MPILNLPAYPRDEWPGLLLDVMHTPAGTESGALFDAIEADALLLEKRGRSGRAVQNHLLASKRQLKSRESWRGFTVGYVLMVSLAEAEAGETRGVHAGALSHVQEALQKRLGCGAGISELKRSWQYFRPVAHLWAAQNIWRCPMKELDHPELLEWTAVAEELRRRGEALRPPKAKTPVLDPDTTWRMPDELALPSVTVELPSAKAIISEIESRGQLGH